MLYPNRPVRRSHKGIFQVSLCRTFQWTSEPEIVFADGLHDFLSFISIAQKETFHIPLWELWIGGYRTVFAIGNLLRKALIYFEWNLIEVVDKWK